MFHVPPLPYVDFVTFEGGQATLAFASSQRRAFWGQRYWDWDWVVSSEMQQCASVCVCVWREDVGEGKWGFAEWQMNGELKDTEGEAIFPESGRRKKKKKGSEMWEALRRQRKRQRRDSHTSSDQRAVSPVYSCETHWRCLSGQLTQVCLHFPLTSFIRVFVCSSRQLWVSKTRSDIFFFFFSFSPHMRKRGHSSGKLW